MDFKRTIVDQIHIFDHTKFTERKKFMNRKEISIVENEHTNEVFICYLVKKDEKFNKHDKIMFIEKCEKSFELIHPSILNLSGFSIQKPYLYYEYIKNQPKKENYERTEILEIIIGIASGLSYLLSKGYYYSKFSIDSIIFDENNRPQLFNYIEFEDSKKMNEKELIIKFVDVITTIIPEENLQFNDNIVSLIKSVRKNENLPTFEEFVQCFDFSDSDSKGSVGINTLKFFSLAKYKDKFRYNESLSFNESLYENEYKSIEEICYYFYEKKPENLYYRHFFILNSLPDYYIKQLFTFLGKMNIPIMRYLQYDDYLKNKDENEETSFKIFIELKKQIKNIEDKINSLIYFDSEREELEYQLESTKNQAIFYLKKSNNVQSKIELAIQYIKGTMLPYNLTKAKVILDSIGNVTDEKTQKIIEKMKDRNSKMLNDISIDNVLSNLSSKQKQKELLEKAKQGSILYMLFVGFSFFTGFNEFPIIRPLSIYFYREAAKKSSYAMNLLGYLYFKGLIFPRNFKRARNCFARAAADGYVKAEIIDGILRKHLYRAYLLEFSIEKIFSEYLPSFQSMFPNDSYQFPLINFYLENNNEIFYLPYLRRVESNLHSENKDELCSMFLEIKEPEDPEEYTKEIKETYSEKILISNESKKNNLTKDKLLRIGKSYFYGLNNYPTNYSKALYYFKLAADKGDSEAQWRYALMIKNSLSNLKSEKDSKEIENYLQKSSNNNNPRGKLLYSLFLRDDENINIFQRLIYECCSSGDLDAMYYYAMHLEKIDESLEQSIHYYKKAANSGHLDSLIRLIYLLKSKSETLLYEKYLNLSVSLLNETFLVKLIIFYDRNKKYDQSNILIQIGIMINYMLFNAYYADHLLFGKGMNIDIEKAQQLVFLAIDNKYPNKYFERYIYVALDIYILKGRHNDAAKFLIKYRSEITYKYKYKFLSFYQKLDKTIAKNYYITVYFYDKKYQEFHEILEELMHSNNNILSIYSKINDLAKNEENVYAMIELGRLKKNGKFISRDLKKVVQYFSFAAKCKCPQGYYYLGKELFYGRILNQDFDEAKKLFLLALKDNGEPRAGYYLYKIPNIRDDDDVDDVNSLKISASFGYKRALYKYGKLLYTGKDSRININEQEGIKLLIQSSYQGYNKASRFCRSHHIHDVIYINVNLLKLDKKTHSNAKNESDLDDSIIDDSSVSVTSQSNKKSYTLIHMKKAPVSNDFNKEKDQSAQNNKI